MDKELIEFFKKNKKRYEYKELKNILKVTDEEEFYKKLKVLEENGIILFDEEKMSVMAFPRDTELVYGKIHINKNNNGYFTCNDESYVILEKYLKDALSGDTILARKTSITNNNRVVCDLVKVIKRSNIHVVGLCDFDGIHLYGHANTFPITIDKKELDGLVPGDRVLINIEDKDNMYIEKVVGHKDDPNIEIDTILAEYDIPTTFSKESIEQLSKIPSEVTEEDLDSRENFTEDRVFTIDCDTTKDMDDAVSVEKLKNGNYLLKVHIAHVAHYIPFGSPLYLDAYERGNSTYLLDTVNPMIPHELSNGICSLNPDVIRLTRTTIIEINNKGDIVDYRLCKGYIKSLKKMNYSSVNKILEEDIVPEGYEDYVDDLKLMNELANIIGKKLKNKGFLEFGSTEIKTEHDNLGKPVSFNKEEHRSAEKLIEYFMIICNVCNAEYCYWNQIPTIYRVHDIPNERKLRDAIGFLRSIGYDIKNVKNLENAKEIQGILKELSKYDMYDVLSTFLLKGMQKACYSTSNEGHFALGLDDYLHSTSPIRRLADLEHQYALDEHDKYLQTMDYNKLDNLRNKFGYAADKASKTERTSDKAEEEANMMDMARYMTDHINEEFTGRIIDIWDGGLKIELNNNIIGICKIVDIMGDNYIYDKDTRCVYGRSSKVRMEIGDEVLVKCIEASVEFRLVKFAILSRTKKAAFTRRLLNNAC